MNYGLDLAREVKEQSPEDWQFGAFSKPCIASIPLSERENYLPDGEVQRGAADWQDCASRGPNNILASKFTYAYQKRLFKLYNIKWLKDKGYVVDNRIDFSDRFVAINSGTTRQGNSLKAPIEAIRKQGLIPKHLLPAEGWMDFTAYHDPSKITQEMKDLGAEFASRFIINYEQVNNLHFSDLLKDDFLDVGLFAWPFPDDQGIYERRDAQMNHVVELFKPQYYAFDNYIDTYDGDYIKHLAQDYAFYDYAYRILISAEGVPTQIVSLYQQLIALLAKMRDILLTRKV